MRGGVGTTATWESETRPDVTGSSTVDRGRHRAGRRRVHDRHRHRHHRRPGDARAQADVPPPADQQVCPGLSHACAARALARPRWRSPARQAARRRPTRPRQPDLPGQPELVELSRDALHRAAGRTASPVLLAEGQIDDNLIPRLQAALPAFPGRRDLAALAGRQCPRRQPGRDGSSARADLPTRIPGRLGLLFGLQLPVHGRRRPRSSIRAACSSSTCSPTPATARRSASEVARGEDNTVGLIGEIEQDSALLASEDNDFLIRMGVSRALLTEVMYRQSAVADASNRSTRRCLTQAEVAPLQRRHRADCPARPPLRLAA